MKLPAVLLKKGYFTDVYFVKSRDVLRGLKKNTNVLMQVFCKQEGILCGVEETKWLLKQCLGNRSKVKVKALKDGDRIRPWETVMTLEGNYADFAVYETVYLGILSRRTAVASNVRKAAEAAKGKPVIFFGARFDHFLMQEGDGYAALVGGCAGVSTDANAAWMNVKSVGTIPHALIASFKGDTAASCRAFYKHFGDKVFALVDFKNDCVKTSLEVARKLGKNLAGVRLDTAENMKDRSVPPRGGRGVSADLVRNVRKALDREGFHRVKIMVSGGFTADKLREFNRLKVPYDSVGIGSWFYRDRIDFTADIVLVEGKPCAKVGRRYRPNPRLKRII